MKVGNSKHVLAGHNNKASLSTPCHLVVLLLALMVSTVISDKYNAGGKVVGGLRTSDNNDQPRRQLKSRKKKSKKNCVDFKYSALNDLNGAALEATGRSILSGVVRPTSDPDTVAENMPWDVTSFGYGCTLTKASDTAGFSYVCTLVISFDDEDEDPTLATLTCSALTVLTALGPVQTGDCAVTGGAGIFEGATGKTTYTSTFLSEDLFHIESDSTWCLKY